MVVVILSFVYEFNSKHIFNQHPNLMSPIWSLNWPKSVNWFHLQISVCHWIKHPPCHLLPPHSPAILRTISSHPTPLSSSVPSPPTSLTCHPPYHLLPLHSPAIPSQSTPLPSSLPSPPTPLPCHPPCHLLPPHSPAIPSHLTPLPSSVPSPPSPLPCQPPYHLLPHPLTCHPSCQFLQLVFTHTQHATHADGLAPVQTCLKLLECSLQLPRFH